MLPSSASISPLPAWIDQRSKPVASLHAHPSMRLLHAPPPCTSPPCTSLHAPPACTPSMRFPSMRIPLCASCMHPLHALPLHVPPSMRLLHAPPPCASLHAPPFTHLPPCASLHAPPSMRLPLRTSLHAPHSMRLPLRTSLHVPPSMRFPPCVPIPPYDSLHAMPSTNSMQSGHGKSGTWGLAAGLAPLTLLRNSVQAYLGSLQLVAKVKPGKGRKLRVNLRVYPAKGAYAPHDRRRLSQAAAPEHPMDECDHRLGRKAPSTFKHHRP
eukprot:356314-Chlamydomonas_euryale.AAC.3